MHRNKKRINNLKIVHRCFVKLNSFNIFIIIQNYLFM